MKQIIFLVFIIHYTTISDFRLIEKVPEVKASTSSPNGPKFPIRLRRHILDDIFEISYSKEESFENSPIENQKTKYVIRSKHGANTRFPRNSNGTGKVDKDSIPVNEKIVLVKKPIPKFVDIDDYYLEPKSLKIARFVESDENEDEDFNVDDYDFDVKHDEYAGRGNHKIPLKESKASTDVPVEVTQEIIQLEIQTEFAPQTTPKVPKQRSINKGENKKEKDDFYDYGGTSSTTEKVDSKDETEESKEDERLGSRMVRSPGHKNLLPTNVTRRAAQPAILPMFPANPVAPTEKESRKDII
nr:unnamed protein product [Amyelois transitella]